MEYTATKQKNSSQWYVRRVDDPAPIPGTYGPKKKAFKLAARMNGMEVRDFLIARKRGVSEHE